MFAPVSKDDFVRLGKRYTSEEIINALDRLLPLATADIEALAGCGYTQELLAELVSLRDQIREGAAGCRQVRGARKGAVAGEEVVLEEGRNVFRRGLALASVAVVRRRPVEGESPDATQEKAAELTSQVKQLGGRLGKDAAVLRTRLAALKSLLTNPDLNPSDAAREEHKRFLERLDKVVATITGQAESKKTLKERSKDKTSMMDELDGRAYANMRLLAKVGRAVFNDLRDKDHARMYSLWELSRKRAGKAEKPGAVVQPLPAAPQPAPAPIQPRPIEPRSNPAVNG